jgi:hypothetical protein
MSSALPLYLSVGIFIEKFEFIAWHKSYVVFIWENEVSHPFSAHVVIKAHFNVPLSLRFFEALVIVSLKLNQRFKYVFVLSWITVSQENRLHRLFLLLFLATQISNLSLRFLFPEFFKFVDVLRSNFS